MRNIVKDNKQMKRMKMESPGIHLVIMMLIMLAAPIALADLPVPQAHTGRSLAPLIGGKEVPAWRKDFLCEFLAVPGTIPRWEGLCGERMTYTRYFVDGPEKPLYQFLFDLKNDPKQLTNLVDGNVSIHFLAACVIVVINL